MPLGERTEEGARVSALVATMAPGSVLPWGTGWWCWAAREQEGADAGPK